MSNGIEPRDLQFNIARNPVRHWCYGDPAITAMIDCFSIFLPVGERFFIRAMKGYKPKVDDPDLRAAIRDFARQEAFHSREHEDYNQAIAALGYDVAAMEANAARPLRRTKGRLKRLAVTCALEHLTTTFSATLLNHAYYLDGAPPHYRRLWLWHALEEVEHRAVALDLLKTATPDMPGWRRYLYRIAVMNGVLYVMLGVWRRNVAIYLARDGVRTGPRLWLRCLWATFVNPGFGRHAIPRFLAYYKPGFDPEAGYDPAFVDAWRVRVAADNAATA